VLLTFNTNVFEDGEFAKELSVLISPTAQRFRMQVILDGRHFPISEASSKKVVKKDAAATTLRILIGEQQGGAGGGEDGAPAPVDQVMDPVPDTTVRNPNPTQERPRMRMMAPFFS